MKTFTGILAVGIICIAAAGTTYGSVVAQFDFDTDGDTEGWAVLNNVSGFDANGGTLNGTAVNQ